MAFNIVFLEVHLYTAYREVKKYRATPLGLK